MILYFIFFGKKRNPWLLLPASPML
uniref:Uncharacterized protein n=1 Tax=Arundo donax TaxID=35708 RepID=A0A0A8Y8R7_ARUDO